MKPNEDLLKVGNHQIIFPGHQEIPVKTEGDSSPASEALQLILTESAVDPKSIMFDLSKFLQENTSLGHVNNQQRVIVSAPSYYALQGGVPIPKRSTSSSYALPGDTLDIEEVYSGPDTTPSSSGALGAGGSSYGASPRAPQSPSYWDQGHLQIKEEWEPVGPGMTLSSGQHIPFRNISPADTQNLFTLQNAGPTLAQLNSPPNDQELTETTLRNLGDLDSLNLDLDALTGEIMFPFQAHIAEIKMEPVVIASTTTTSSSSSSATSSSIPCSSLQWAARADQLHQQATSHHLSTSVPVSVISSTGDYQELSNLSNGGPAVSPTRLTLSPPVRTSISPLSQPVSPQIQSMIPTTVPARGSPAQHASTLHELLLRQESTVPDPIRPRSNSNQFKSARRPIAARQRNSLSISNPLLASQLSKSAPVKTLPIEQMIWSRRDPRPHINSVCSNAGDSSIADEVSEVLNSLSPSELNDIDSEDEDLSNNELDSDEDLKIDEDDCSSVAGSAGKKERHFWQYNVQAKGPKGMKMALDTKIMDPHRLNDIIDPVFSDNVQIHGIKHSGKARRGDGNDLTANPKKLAAIGKELDKLNKEINLMTPVSEVPLTTRTKSRKEKNKLASRACRLKKKAQHEANKLKLHGLEEEHSELMRSIYRVKEILQSKWGSSGAEGAARPQEELTQEADRLLKRAQKNRVAGYTTEYVNRMIAKYS